MSLLTRLWLAATGAMLLALTGAFVLSLATARDYLTQQLFAQGTDAAAALALTLSQQGSDKTTATVLVSALFDSGHFEAVRFRDMSGNVVVERVNLTSAPEAPEWFVKSVPLDARVARREVAAQWKPVGAVEIKPTSRFAHAALWRGGLRLGGMMLVLALALGSVMTAFVHWIKRPVDRMVGQADAIGQGRFVRATDSEVPELRSIGNALNVMVDRIASMFDEQSARIDELRSAANRDEVSGLPNRGWFVGRLRDLLAGEGSDADGTLILARINDLGAVNRKHGRARGDALVGVIAGALRSVSAETMGAVVARLNGADFALLIPASGDDRGERATTALRARLAGSPELKTGDGTPAVFVGAVHYRRGENPREVMARADNALMRSESGLAPLSAPTGSEGPARVPLLPDDWRALIDSAIAGRRFALASFPVIAADGQPLHREVMLRLLPADGGPPIAASDFVPAAQRLDRIAAIDLAAVELALDEALLQLEGVAVNLSGVSVQQPAFIDALMKLLRNASDRSDRLWLEVSERSLSESHGVADLAALAGALTAFGCRIGIDHFGRDFAALPRLYEIGLDYLKIDASFVAGIDDHPGNRQFVKTVVDVAASLDIAVYAEGVSNEAEWDTLRKLGVAAMTGPVANAHRSG